MAQRKRGVPILFRVSPEEREQIDRRMAELGIVNMAAYLRKMALDGYIVNLDIPELRELVSLMRRSSNNLNQIAKRVNTTGRIYASDMEDMLQKQEQLWEAVNTILLKLASIR